MNVAVTVNGGELSAKEQAAYIDYLENKHNRILDSLDITLDGDFVDLHYKFQPVGFERIRRITGYLVGTMVPGFITAFSIGIREAMPKTLFPSCISGTVDWPSTAVSSAPLSALRFSVRLRN